MTQILPKGARWFLPAQGHEALCRTSEGAWLLHSWPKWQPPAFLELDPEAAAVWLLGHGHEWDEPKP